MRVLHSGLRLLKLVLSAAYQVSTLPTKLGIKIDLFSRPARAGQEQQHDLMQCSAGAKFSINPGIIKGDINPGPQYNDYLIF